MSKYCIVMSTFENEDQANVIIEAVLKENLAACIQTTGISSHYTWNGEICHDKEILVLFKTPACHYDELKEKIKSMHPYETPEIIKVPIEDGLPAYLGWMDEVTK